ncbi:MAG TPA: carbohydrate porin [Anaeromyxobacter sp.]|nr:carbohydrate porin [Anaeromyxobacter sp.]
MKGTIKAALLALAVVAYAAPAYAVPGVDFFGYFRDGFAGNSKGGGMTCFKTPTMDYKLRLGNECDNYGEWGLEGVLVKEDDGAVFTAGLMFNYDQDTAQPTGTATPFGIQQNYFKAKFPQWNGITFWGGKQYYERENIDMIDFFYLNTSDTGIGFENLDTGFGKLSFSVFSYKPVKGTPAANTGADIAGFRPDLRLQGLPLGGFGTLMIDVNVVSVSRNSTVLGPLPSDDTTTGWWFTLEHNYSGFLGNSSNTLTFQWANAINSGMGNISGLAGGTGFTTSLGGGATTDPLNKNNQQLRVLDWLMIAPNAQFQVGIGGMYQSKTWGNPGASNITSQQYGLFARPYYWFSDYFLIQGDIGYTANTYSNSPVYTSAASAQDANLTKFCIAPTLAPKVGNGQNGFWMRPQFRLFYTYGSWSSGANHQNPPTGGSSPVNFASSAGGTATSGSTFGAQVEGWF